MADIPVRVAAFDDVLITAPANVRSDGVESEVGFERIFRDHSRAILGSAARRVAQPDEAADVLSEVMLVAWRRRAEVPRGAEERLWLYGVARRVIANQTRSATRRGR